MYKRRFPGASQCSGSYVQFVIQCQRLRSRLLLSRWYCRGCLGRSSCLPVPASSVSYERGSTAHLWPASLRPHLQRTLQPPLALGSGESTVQDGRARPTHGTAPSYLSQLVRVTDLPDRRSFRSARTNRLLVPSVKLSTVGGQAFPVAGRDINPVSVNFPSAFKNISVPGLIP